MVKSILAAFATLLVTGASASAAPAGPPIPRNVITAAMKKADCSLPLKHALEGIDVSALDDKLKLVEVPCWRAAYQAGSIFLAVDPKAPQNARLLRFHEWSNRQNQLTIATALSNPGFDSATKIMSAGHKGRGVGDCGTAAEWKWNGRDFMLLRYWIKDACDGEPFDNDRKWQVYPPRR
jgi:hypothetical protein